MTRESTRTGLHAVGVPPAQDPRALAALSCGLVAAALALGGALALTGAAWPAPGPVVLLALLAWFAVNRYTFFPSELAATSESAVLLAAVVVFRADAPYLGPWVVAALVGPLDALHWEQRAFARMGFNAAQQMFAVVAAAAAGAEVAERVSPSYGEWAGAGASVCVYALVVWAIGVVALRVWSKLGFGDAVRALLAVDWILVPLAVFGACAGIAATAHGWWALPLVLIPVAFVPELVVGHGRSLAAAFAASARVRIVVVLVVGALLLAPAAVVLGSWAVVVLGVLVLAGLAAVELLPARPARVPPLAGVVVAVTVAMAGLGVPWSSPVRALSAHGAGLLVALLAAGTARSGARARELARVGWAIPLLAGGAAAALTVARAGPEAVGFPVLLVVGAAVLVVAWGLPPWRSAVLVRALAPRRFARRRWVLLAFVAVGLVLAGVVTVGQSTSTAVRTTCALGALVVTEVVLVLASVGARQWRLDPRRRRIVGTLVATGAVATLGVVPSLARYAPRWVLPVIAVALMIGFVVGDRPARLGDDAEPEVTDARDDHEECPR